VAQIRLGASSLYIATSKPAYPHDPSEWTLLGEGVVCPVNRTVTPEHVRAFFRRDFRAALRWYVRQNRVAFEQLTGGAVGVGWRGVGSTGWMAYLPRLSFGAQWWPAGFRTLYRLRRRWWLLRAIYTTEADLQSYRGTDGWPL